MEKGKTYSEVETAHVVLEDRTEREPGRVVDARRRRETTDTSKHDRNVDVSPQREGVTSGEDVEWDGEQCADEEEVQHRVVPTKKRRHLDRGLRESKG